MTDFDSYSPPEPPHGPPPEPGEGRDETRRDWSNAFILAGAVVGIITVAAISVRGQSDVRTTAILGFCGYAVMQLNGMLRATLEGRRVKADLKENTEKTDRGVRLAAQVARTADTISHRVNGGLDRRIEDAVGRAVDDKMTGVREDITDIRGELHKIKHDIGNVAHKEGLIQGLIAVATGQRAEPDGRPQPPAP